jgi:hypothetical protein
VMRGIARSFKISRNTLTGWLKAQGVCAAAGASARAETDAGCSSAFGQRRGGRGMDVRAP